MSVINVNTNIDLTYLREVASGNTEFMIEMIDIFMEQTPIFVDDLTKAIDAKDWQKIAEISHKIKPTLAFIGVDSGRTVMEEIEKDARSEKNYEEIVEKFSLMKEIFKTIFENLEVKKQELMKEG